MERLTIDIPESKSVEIKQFLKGMGVIVQNEKHFDTNAYRKKLINVGEWSEEDLKAMEDSKSVVKPTPPPTQMIKEGVNPNIHKPKK